MSSEYKYDLEDLINSAIMQKPSEFESAFNDLVTDRLRSAIENKKVEIAQTFYSREEDFTEEEE
jgi:hypothetical protein